MRTVALSGWGQPYNSLSGILPDAHHIDYVHLDSLDAALEKIAKDAAGADVAIGWSLGGKLLAHAISRGLIAPKKLVLIGVPFQFVQSENLALGLPRDTYETFCANYESNPRRTLKKGWDLIAYKDVNEAQVQEALAKYDLKNELERGWGKWLSILNRFTCHDLKFAHFPPTLIIHGDRDEVVWSEQARHFDSQLPKSQLEIWEGCGHAPHWHNPEALKKLIRDFTQHV